MYTLHAGILLKGAPLKLSILHKVVPEACAILKRQGVLGSVQLKVEAVGASCRHGSDA